MQFLPILLSILQFIDQLYKSLIGVLWYACIYYGLNPHYSFLLPFLGNSEFISLTNSLYAGFFFQFSVLILLFASLGALIINIYSRPNSGYTFLFKWIVAVLAGAVSVFVITWLLSLVGTLYSAIFNSTSFSWYNFLNFSSYSTFSQVSNTQSGSLGILIEIFALTGYFVSVTSLLAILMLRQALMLFAIVLVPFATILGSTSKGKRFSSIVWEIIIEMSAYPFFVLLSLYLAHIFAWDVPLQLAFLFLPTIIPGYLLATGNSFLNAPIFGFLGGLSLSGAASRGLEAANIATMPLRGGSIGGSVRDAAMLPLREKHFINEVPRNNVSKREMPWKELLNDELKYRRERLN